jgi:hypothetical protein
LWLPDSDRWIIPLLDEAAIWAGDADWSSVRTSSSFSEMLATSIDRTLTFIFTSSGVTGDAAEPGMPDDAD